MNLAESYRVVITKIRAAGCIWVEGSSGWYHSFDKMLIKERILELESEIVRLSKKALEDCSTKA